MSWIIVRNATGEAVAELYEKRLVDRVNRDKYQAMPALEYLQSLSRKNKQPTK